MFKIKNLACMTVAAGLIAFSGSALAQSVAPADQKFMKEAAQGGLAEVELGNLAKDHAASQDVKNFGDRMVTDHSKANDELKNLAQQKNVTLPTTMSPKDQATKDRLSKLNGAAFDHAYMRDMVADHRKDVADFKKESNTAKDSDLKAWAGKTLPTLEEHLKMAQDVTRDMGGKMSNGKMSNNNMSNDKMTNDKMTNDKMTNDKMTNDKMTKEKK